MSACVHNLVWVLEGLGVGDWIPVGQCMHMCIYLIAICVGWCMHLCIYVAICIQICVGQCMHVCIISSVYHMRRTVHAHVHIKQCVYYHKRRSVHAHVHIKQCVRQCVCALMCIQAHPMPPQFLPFLTPHLQEQTTPFPRTSPKPRTAS